MPTPFNRPVVLTLARVDSSQRIIPAERVREIEDVASGAASAGHRIREAEALCREDLTRTTHEAWQRGFARGHAEALQSLREFLAAVEARRKAIDQELMALVADAVGRIVRNLPADLLMGSLIETALAEVQAELGRLVLRVHPDRAIVAETWLRQSAARGIPSIMVEPDATMAQDDCVLETPAGAIDAGLQTQLAALRAVLDDAVRPDREPA
jgi:type III secretion protein L